MEDKILKVLIQWAGSFSKPGPSNHLLKNLIEDMIKNEIEVHLIQAQIDRKPSDSMIPIEFINSPKFSYDNVKRKDVSKKNFVRRYLSEVLYVMRTIPFWKKLYNFDLIFVRSGPSSVYSIIFAKLFFKKRVLYGIQDIWPNSAMRNTSFYSKFIEKAFLNLQRLAYRYSDKITVISKDMKNTLIEIGVSEEKIEVIYNWIDENEIVPIDRNANSLFDRFKLDRNYFYVVYAGNLGYAQNIEVILEAAERLEKYTDIRFVIFGGGQQEDYYKDMAKTMKLKNVYFFPLQPYSLVSNVYSLGDVSIVSCKEGFGKNAMPSKTWSIMSAGTAIIASFDEETDLHKMIEENNLGLFSKSGDHNGLMKAILTLYHDRGQCKTMGLNGRDFIKKNLTRKIGTHKFINCIRELEEESYV